MSDEDRVTPVEEVLDISLEEVMLPKGKGALGKWRAFDEPLSNFCRITVLP